MLFDADAMIASQEFAESEAGILSISHRFKSPPTRVMLRE